MSNLERQRIEKLIIANKHNRLTFEAIAAINSHDVITQMKKAKELLEFRIEYKDLLRMNWNRFFINQAEYGLAVKGLAKHYDELTRKGVDLDGSAIFKTDKIDNGSFEDGFHHWTVNLWKDNKGSEYSGEDIGIDEADAYNGEKYLQVKIHDPNFEDVYIIHQNVTVKPGKNYIFSFTWRRRNPDTGSEYGGMKSGQNLLCPRYRLMMKDENGANKEVIWGNVSNRSENTDWVSQSRLLSIADMGVSQIFVSFFLTTEGENHLDKVEMLEF